MNVNLSKGIGFEPDITMTIELNVDEIIIFDKIIKKVLKDKKLTAKEKQFFLPILKTYAS